MTPERWRRIQEVFFAVSARPPAERDALLAAECGSDTELRRKVERMLAADERSASLLDQAPVAPVPARPDRVGERVGPYQIIRELGRGGMGSVYLAERTDVGKRVALKLVRSSLGASENIERFLLERRVLARLEHPNIAQLFDAGVADDGTPYFAMEYVRGQPLDRYCDEHRSSIDARLALFERVCAAVALAHANDIVHRDLKPSNILVTEPSALDAGEQVKLLDFGIAKVLDRGGAEDTLTHSDYRPMTPEYAAPEQLAGGPITPATDVYALGIVLYRLLCGHRVRPATDGAAQDVPPPPSVMVGRATTDSGASVTPEMIAQARSATPAELRTALDGPLDRIALTALAHAPEDRYPSAAELLEDVRRYRAGLAPQARARGWRPLMTRRRRVAIGAALIAIVALLATPVVRAWRTRPPASAGVIAVLPFEYRGPGEHRYLSEGVVSLLSSAFDATQGLRAVEPRALLGFVARNGRGNDAPGGNAVARRFGAPLYVTGDVVEVEGQLRITAMLRDTSDRVLARVPVDGRADSVFSLLDEVAVQLLAAILDDRNVSLARSAALTTRSLPALQAYVRGELALRTGQYGAASDAFERAIAEDSGFALAYYRLSTTDTWTGRVLLRRTSAQLAAALASKLGPVDSLRVVSWMQYLDGEPAAAARGFREIARNRPDDVDAWFQLGETEYHWMPSLGYPAAAARQAFERVLQLEPENSGALIHLVRIAATERDRPALDSFADRLLGIAPDRARVLEVNALRAFAAGDSVARKRASDQLKAANLNTLQTVAVVLGATGVDPQGAADVAYMLARAGTSPSQRAIGHVLALQSLAASGRFTEVAEGLVRLREISPHLAAQLGAVLAITPLADPSREQLRAIREELAILSQSPRELTTTPPFQTEPFAPVQLYLSGMLDLRLGDSASALRNAERLGSSTWPSSSESIFAREYAALIRAEMLSARSAPDAALRTLGSSELRPGATLPELMRHTRARERWLRAELHRELGHDAEALRWYASFPDPTAYDVQYLAASHLRRAELHDRRGERAEAARHFCRFVELWRDADAPLQPQVARAREWLQRAGRVTQTGAGATCSDA